MKREQGVILASLTIIIAVVLAVPAGAQAKEKNGGPVISKVAGDVSVKPAGSEAWQPVKEAKYKLRNGSTIKTTTGSATISCPDGSTITLADNATATLSIAKDGRVQIDAAQGSVTAILGRSGVTAELGPDQAIQEKSDAKTGDIDISCVKGKAAVRMPNGTKVAMDKGDVITASPKKNLVRSQAGSVEVTKGTGTQPLNVGFEIVIADTSPFIVRRFPYAHGSYGYMTEYVTTTDTYTFTDETVTVEEQTVDEKAIEEPAAAEEEKESAGEEKGEPESDMTYPADNTPDTTDTGDTGGDTGGGDTGGDTGGGDSGGDGGGGE